MAILIKLNGNYSAKLNKYAQLFDVYPERLIEEFIRDGLKQMDMPIHEHKIKSFWAMRKINSKKRKKDKSGYVRPRK